MALAQASTPRAAVRHQAGSGTGWYVLVLLAVLLGPLVWTLHAGQWGLLPLPLVLVAGTGLLLGLALAHWRTLPALVAHWLALALLGIGVLRLYDRLLTPAAPGWGEQVEALAFRLYLWIDALQRYQDRSDPVLVGVGLTSLAFLLAYQVAWTTFRRGWFWLTIVPTGLVLLIATSKMATSNPLPLMIYLVGAIGLLAHSGAAWRRRQWWEAGATAPPRLVGRTALTAAFIGLLLVTVSSRLPVIERNARAADAWDAATQPWQDVRAAWERALDRPGSPIQVAGRYADFGTGFELGGELSLSDDPVAWIDSSEPQYLRAVTYDSYTGHGWTTTTPDSFTASNGTIFSSQVQLGANLRLPSTGPATTSVAKIDILRSKGSLLLVPGQFVAAPEPVHLRVSWIYYDHQRIELTADGLADLPAALNPLVNMLQQARDLPVATRTIGIGPAAYTIAEWAEPRSPAQAQAMAQIKQEIDRLGQQRGIMISLEPTADGRVGSITLTGYVPRYADVEAVYAAQALQAGSTYRVMTSTGELKADELRLATAPAPAWVSERYLALPKDVPSRVLELAQTITADATNPYDRAKALEQALRTLTYDEKIEVPPHDRDAVDYFLFDSKRGYCEYFASAMVVMARSLDIPARVVTGYNPGEPSGTGRLIRERNAHAWVEIYFTGYGWVPFEPTPSVAADARGDSPAAVPAPVDLSTPVPTPPARDEQPDTQPDQPREPAKTAAPTVPAPLVAAARILLFVLLSVLALAGAVALVWWRGVHGLSGAGRWYGRLLQLGTWLGLGPKPVTTPREYAARLSRAVPEAARPVEEITRLYIEERFAGRRPTTEQEATLQRAWQRARTLLLRRGPRLGRQASPSRPPTDGRAPRAG